MVEELLNYTNNLGKAKHILARIVCAKGRQDREAVREAPTVRSVKLARWMIDMVATLEVTEHVNTKLVTSSPLLKDGRWVTQGWLCKGLAGILGLVYVAVETWTGICNMAEQFGLVYIAVEIKWDKVHIGKVENSCSYCRRKKRANMKPSNYDKEGELNNLESLNEYLRNLLQYRNKVSEYYCHCAHHVVLGWLDF